jgi:ParB family transcriptional regulator, chromosome partitioning protein
MSEKRRGLGRGLGALIPSATQGGRGDRPVDVFFPGGDGSAEGTPEGAAVGAVATPPAVESADSGRPGPDTVAESSPLGQGEDVSRETPIDLMEVPGALFAELDTDCITPNPRQPRTSWPSSCTRSVRLGFCNPLWFGRPKSTVTTN